MRGETAVWIGAVVAIGVAVVLAVVAGNGTIAGIGAVAFVAMVGGAALGAYGDRGTATLLVWGYGVASGAMVTSASVFLLPSALGHDLGYGGLGVGVGLLAGFGAHTVGHRLGHADLPGVDRTTVQLTAHSLAAGVIIGVVYGNASGLGPTLGVAIVSHKAPAGYAAATRLGREGWNWRVLSVPAAAVGVAAVAASAVSLPAGAVFRAGVFGFAAGVFLHVAMDFLPRCELGSEVHDALSVDEAAHERLDRLRSHAVASTALGAAAVVFAWQLVGRVS